MYNVKHFECYKMYRLFLKDKKMNKIKDEAV